MSGLTEEDVDIALDFLGESCDEIALAKAELERSEILRKRVRRKRFLASSGTVAEREALAEADPEVYSADERYISAVVSYEALRAKRDLRVIQIDVFRSQEASRRMVRP